MAELWTVRETLMRRVIHPTERVNIVKALSKITKAEGFAELSAVAIPRINRSAPNTNAHGTKPKWYMTELYGVVLAKGPRGVVHRPAKAAQRLNNATLMDCRDQDVGVSLINLHSTAMARRISPHSGAQEIRPPEENKVELVKAAEASGKVRTRVEKEAASVAVPAWLIMRVEVGLSGFALRWIQRRSVTVPRYKVRVAMNSRG
jgi:hypothetical protein